MDCLASVNPRFNKRKPSQRPQTKTCFSLIKQVRALGGSAAIARPVGYRLGLYDGRANRKRIGAGKKRKTPGSQLRGSNLVRLATSNSEAAPERSELENSDILKKQRPETSALEQSVAAPAAPSQAQPAKPALVITKEQAKFIPKQMIAKLKRAAARPRKARQQVGSFVVCFAHRAPPTACLLQEEAIDIWGSEFEQKEKQKTESHVVNGIRDLSCLAPTYWIPAARL